ncbi:DNRLRE domain-containing protein [Streptomyces sparsus]
MPSRGQRTLLGRRRERSSWTGLTSGTLLLALGAGLLPSSALPSVAHAAPSGSAEAPQQRTGSAADREHAVDAGKTDANGRNTKAPDELAVGEDALPLAESGGGFAPLEPDVETATVRQETGGESHGAKGFDQEASKELPGARSRSTKEFANPDGTRTTRVYPEPVHYRDEAGEWKEIDPTLVPAEEDAAPAARSFGSAEAGTERSEMTADDSGLTFAGRGDDPLLAQMEVGDAGNRVAFGLDDAETVRAELDGDTVRFPGIREDADLTLRAEHGTIKETIVLNSPDAPRTWTFPLTLDGLRPELDEDGSVLLRDEEGEVRAVVPTPWMEDSSTDPASGDPVISDAVSYSLEERGEGWALRVTAADAWLDAPEREYPVLVDPSVDDIETYGDSFVQDDFPNTNFGGDDELKVGSYNGGASRAVSYLRFDNVTSQLKNRYILNADLGLLNHWSSSCSAHEVRVHQVKEAWQAGKVTWKNQPSVVSSPVGAASFAHGENCSGPKWQTIDLGLKGVNLVQDWVDGSTGNYGLSLRAGYTDSGAWKRFGSKNSANEPYLAITHSAWGAEYSVGSQTEPLTGHQGGEVTVTVKNLGSATWEALGWNEFRLGARVREFDSGKLLDAVAFTRFHERVTPGDSATVDARIPELPPGKYKINFDVQRLNDQKWISSENVPVATVTMTSQDVGPRITDVYPQPGGQVGSLTPALFVDAETVDHYPAGAEIEHWFEVCEGTTDDPVDCTDSGWVDPRTWTVPADMLAWGESYVWRVKAREADLGGPMSPYYPFTTAVEQPAITSHLGGASADGREVDPRTGNYTTSATDAQVATTGPALTVTRTYNSRDPRDDNAFGAGWSTRYDMRIEADGDGTGNVVATYPSGRQVRFGKNPDGSYAPPHGSFATLTRTGDDGWRLTDKNQTGYLFDETGRITEVTDFRGRTQTLAYDGDGHLTDAASPGGRTLSFTWSDGHVASVTTDRPDPDSDPLTWTYDYDGHRLTEVCGPEDAAGTCTRYTYGDGSHHRTVVRDSGPFSYWRLNEEAGAEEARSDLLLDGDNHAGTYRDVELGTGGALSGSPDTAATFNGTSSYVQLPNQLVSDTPYLTVGLWFRTTEDGVLFSYQNHTLEEETTGKLTPALYVGTDGKLRGEFWNGESAPITSEAAVNDGQWHHAALSAAGNTQTLYLDGDRVGTATGAITQYDQRFVYLGAGYWKNWPATSGTIGHFDGDIDEVAVHTRPLGARTIAEQHASGAQDQQLTKVTLPSGRTHSAVEYDAARDRVAAYTDADGGRYELSEHVLTGADGKPATDGQDAVPEDPTVTVTVTDPDERTSSHSYDPLQGHRRVAQKDTDGNTATFTYDTGGFLAATTGPDGTVTRLGHDERGNKLSQTTCRDAGEDASCHTSHYAYFLNEDDPLDPRNDQLTAKRDARSADAEDDTYRTSYGYNTFGDRISTTAPATPGFPEGRTETHTFTDGTESAVGGGTVPAGLLAKTMDARGGETLRKYDAAGDLVRVTDPAGLVTEYTYDALGRELTRTDISDAHPDGVETTTRYDGASRVVRAQGPATTNAVTGDEHQAVTNYTYDADGLLRTESISDTASDDPARTTERRYDDHGRLATLIGPEQEEEQYTYDVYGHQTSRITSGGETFRYSYTAGGDLAEVTLKEYTDGGGDPADVVLDSYAYDPAGRLAEHTDAMGRTTRHTYYDDGLLAKKILTGFHNEDGSTRDLVLSENRYDAAGHLTTETIGNGETTTTYEVDAAGRTTAQVLDPQGLARRTEFTHDAGGSVASETRTGAGGERTERTTFERNIVGKVIRETIENGSEDLVTTREVDDRGLVLVETSPRGNADGGDPAAHTTEYRYDSLGRRTEVRAPAVVVETHQSEARTEHPVTRSGYNAFGELTASTDPNGHVTRTTYDGAGRAVRTTLPDYTPPGADEPLTTTVTRTYDAAGNIATETDPLGGTTAYRYDQLGNPTRVTGTAPHEGADRPVTRYTYDLLGERLSVTGPTGARTEATYDDLGRQITSTVIERHPVQAAYTTRLSYDDQGNLTSTTAPGGAETAVSHNAAGQPVTETDAAGGSTSYAYGPTGLTTAVTDPLGRTTRSVHDLAGRTVEVTDLDTEGSEQRTRRSAHDAEGNPVSVTNALGHTVTQNFDALNRLTELTEPVDADTSITTTFGYDAAGHRTRLTDGRGNTTWTTYTSHGKPEAVIEPATAAHAGAADRTYTTAYDAAGRAVRESQPGGVTQQRTYDATGNLTRATGSGAEADTGTDTFTYDLAGRLTSVSAPGGTNSYTYDDRGNLLSSEGPSGSATFTYDADSRPTARTDAAGETTFGYDTAGRLTSAADPLTGTTQGYGYNAASQPTSVTYGTGGAARSLSYDGLGRLSADTLKNPDGDTTASLRYAYDAGDRLTGKTTAGTAGAGEHTYTYDRADRLTGWTAPDGTETPYTWDAAGNRTSAGEATATYDERNRLLTADGSTYTYTPRGTQSSVTDSEGEKTTAAFDALGRMVTSDGTDYTYDGLGRLVQRGEETVLRYADHSNNAARTGDQLVTRDPSGNPLATSAADGSDATAVLTDAHGDITGTFTPDTGSLAGSSAYSPFGEVTAKNGTTGSLGYQGEYTDPDTGEVNMHARWYDPAAGGFTSRDPATLNPAPSVQANRYTYANGSPLLNTDPSGHWAFPIIGAGVGVGLGISTGAINAATWIGVGAAAAGTGYKLWDWFGPSGGTNSASGSSSWHSSNSAAAVRAQAEAARNAAIRAALRAAQAAAAARAAREAAKFRWPNTGTPGFGGAGGGGLRGGGGGTNGGNGGLGGGISPNLGLPRPLGPPPPPPPPPWKEILRALLETSIARSTTEAETDAAHEEFADDSHTRSQRELRPDESYVPEDALEFLPAPQNAPGGRNGGRMRDDNACDDGPGVSPTGHAVYLPRERYYDGFSQRQECRATGVYGILDKSDLTTKKHPGPGTSTNDSTRPPGYEEIRALGGVPHNGHLIPKAGGGSGTDLRNLVPEFDRVNAPYISGGVEKEIRDSLRAGHTVAVSITPHYNRGNSGIPGSIEYNYGVVETGMSKHCVVYNDSTLRRTTGSLDCPRR